MASTLAFYLEFSNRSASLDVSPSAKLVLSQALEILGPDQNHVVMTPEDFVFDESGSEEDNQRENDSDARSEDDQPDTDIEILVCSSLTTCHHYCDAVVKYIVVIDEKDKLDVSLKPHFTSLHPDWFILTDLIKGDYRILFLMHRDSCSEYTRNTYFVEFVDSLAMVPETDVSFELGADYFFNTEQLSRVVYHERVDKVVAGSIKTIDYCRANALHGNMHNPQYDPLILPILFRRDALIDRPEKEYDISFIGYVTPRRKEILDGLKQLGYDVRLVESFDRTEKLQEVLKSRILLNIHAGDDYIVFEYPRCSIPVFNGQLVVSEECGYIDSETGTNALVASHVVFCSYNKIITEVVRMLTATTPSYITVDVDAFQRATERDITEFRRSRDSRIKPASSNTRQDDQ